MEVLDYIQKFNVKMKSKSECVLWSNSAKVKCKWRTISVGPSGYTVAIKYTTT